MSEFNTQTRSYAQDSLNAYLTKVFAKMGLGLLVTAAIAALSYFTNIYYYFFAYTGAIGTIILIALQFGVCIGLSAKITTMNTTTANALFFAYAAITGFTFSTLFYAYDIGTVFGAFAFSAVMFASCAVIGLTTNKDLSKFSTLLIGALFALVIATIVSMFIPALRNSLILSYLGVIIFLGLTAWDIQKIRSIYYGTGGYGQLGENMAVYGAFQLYLDFINIFLYVLRILGSRSSRD